DYLDRILSLFNVRADDALIQQVMLIGGLAWLGCGALAYGVGRWLRQPDPTGTPPTPKADLTPSPVSAGGGAAALALDAQPFVMAAAVAEADVLPRPRSASTPPDLLAKPERRGRKRRPFLLGMIEASMMLGAVDLLFGAFVL